MIRPYMAAAAHFSLDLAELRPGPFVWFGDRSAGSGLGRRRSCARSLRALETGMPLSLAGRSMTTCPTPAARSRVRDLAGTTTIEGERP